VENRSYRLNDAGTGGGQPGPQMEEKKRRMGIKRGLEGEIGGDKFNKIYQ